MSDSFSSSNGRRSDLPGLMAFGGAMLMVGVALGYFISRATVERVEPTQVAVVSPTHVVEGKTPAPASTVSSSNPLPAEGGPATPDAAATAMLDVIARVRHFKGDPNAPVTIVEFSDFQCPFCGRFAAETEPQINSEYVATGRARFGYVHFAFLGQESIWAGEASECANEQNAFWEYHDYLFTHQNGENQGAFTKENLKTFAAALKLDTEAFNTCLDSGKHVATVQNDTQFGQALGARSTPSFLVNGRALVGAQPFSAFQQIVEAAPGANQ